MNTISSILRIPVFKSISGGVLNSCRSLFTRPQLPIIGNNSNFQAPMFGLGSTGSGLLATTQGLLGGVSGRTNIRNHFPRPSEIKRIRRHGWKARMSTPGGRRVLMNRILKGRHVYSH